MTHCDQCGNENRDGARFCRFCGETLEAPAPQAEITEAAETELQGAAEGVPEAAALEVYLPPLLQDLQAEETEQTPQEPLAPVAEAEQGTEDEAVQEEETVSTPPVPIAQISEDEPQDAVVETAVEEQAELLPEPEGEGSDQAPAAAAEEFEQRIQEAQAAWDGPVQVGEILQERYAVTAVISSEQGAWVYEAEDKQACWACGTVQMDPEPNFCEMCGAQLTQKSVVHLIMLPEDSQPEEGLDTFTENGVTYQVVVPGADAAQEPKPVRIQLDVGYQSDVGLQRDIDEDSILVMQVNGLCEMENSPALNFFAVADGIGGHDAGEIASRTAVHALAAAVMESIFLPSIRQQDFTQEEVSSVFVETVKEANEALLLLRSQAEQDTNMGCTLTAALVQETNAVVVNIGDSRTYHMRNGVLSKITNDHSIVARLLERGMVQPEEIYTHEQKGIIYRSLGDKADLEVDTFYLELQPGDRLILCCDGLWEMLRDPYIEDVLLELYDPQAACDRLVQLANQAGGEDNISVIIVNINELPWQSG